MTGYAVRGHMGFVPKEGENFDARLNVRLHRDKIDQMTELKHPDDSLADYIRAALDEKINRERKGS